MWLAERQLHGRFFWFKVLDVSHRTCHSLEMRFVIGICHAKLPNKGPYIAVSTAWAISTLPPFNIQKTSIQELRTTAAACAVTSNWDEVVTLEACLQRTLEKMYLKNLIASPLNDYPPAIMILQKPVHLSMKYEIDSDHWAIECTQKVLNSLLVGEPQ